MWSDASHRQHWLDDPARFRVVDRLFDLVERTGPHQLLQRETHRPEMKQKFAAMDRYCRAPGELGGSKVFVLPLSSKLLSTAPLLACYDQLYCQSEDTKMMSGIQYEETVAYGDPNQDPEGGFELCLI